MSASVGVRQPSPPPAAQTKRKSRRQLLLKHLRRALHRHEPENITCLSAGCGKAMVRIGENVSERLDIVPAEFFVERHAHGKWACRCCQVLVQEPVEPLPARRRRQHRQQHVERPMRPWAMERKAGLFCGSEKAGQRAAVVMSLVVSAKLNGHDPWTYLKDVLTRRPTQPNGRIEDLLPHRWGSTAAGEIPAQEEHLSTDRRRRRHAKPAYRVAELLPHSWTLSAANSELRQRKCGRGQTPPWPRTPRILKAGCSRLARHARQIDQQSS